MPAPARTERQWAPSHFEAVRVAVGSADRSVAVHRDGDT